MKKKKTKKVLMVLSTINIDGGVQNKIMDIYRKIDRSRVQFDFFVHAKLDYESYENEILSMGGQIHYIGRVKEIGIIKYIIELYRIMKKNKYQAVHSYIGIKDGLILMLARLAKIKIRISHARSNVKASNQKKFLSPLLKSLIKYNATHLLASSEQAGKSLYGNGSFEVIPNALNIDKFKNIEKEQIDYLKEKIKLNNNELVLGHVGRFSYEKNHGFLLEIARELKNRSFKFKIILIGDGELKGDIEKKIKEYNLENHIYIAGAQQNVELYYHIIDILLFPSLHEGFGNVAVEAQVAKKFVIASKGVSPEVDLGLKLIEFISVNEIDVWLNRIMNFDPKDTIEINDSQLTNVLKSRLFDIEQSIEKYYSIYSV